ncbi:hypothetical protein Cgig2_012865 [Carnegiea gigantea]|uniref:Uncharacterized protein n=1 Tax=Carnegiea gigantea TaxID=171969 RepID=A0A9Q1JYE4_9CARY|nr:hypothetical protein Cgig2_012865 [Carnegiea gigantea]
MSSLFPTTLRSNDLLSIVTNFLHPPFILLGKPESDEKERARHQPKVEMAHRSSHHQNHRHLQALLEAGLQKQCAGENPARLRSPEQLLMTDMPAQREPAGTETVDQLSQNNRRPVKGNSAAPGDLRPSRFLWMVRIGGGVFPVIKEPDFLVNGDYRVDKGAALKMYDQARGVKIGNKNVKLEYLEEAFTTSNWIVRIYKVKPPNNRW